MRGASREMSDLGVRSLGARLALTSGLVTVLVAALASSAVAQEARDGAVYDEIIVTAQKREQSLQDVPASITALTAETLQNHDVNSFEDYMSLVPGLSSNFDGPVNNLGVRPIGLRGVQTLNNTQASGQNTVGFYINNTPVPITNPRLVDIERIEVLRGPQGTLYGASSLGGTIRIITRAPQIGVLEAYGSTSVSATEESDGLNRSAEGSMNIPLGDRAAVRVSAYLEQNAGFVDFVQVSALTGAAMAPLREDVNDERALGARFDMAYEVTRDLTVRAAYSYNQRSVDALDQYTPSQPGLTAYFPLLQPARDRSNLSEFDVEWDLGPWQLSSNTSYYEQRSTFLNDFSIRAPLVYLVGGAHPTSLGAPNLSTQREFTHETRIASQWEGPFQAILGVFYTDRQEISSSIIPVPDGVYIANPAFTIPNEVLFQNYSPRNRREAAIFGQVDYAFSDRLTGTVGLRYYDFHFRNYDEFEGSALFVADGNFVGSGEADDDGFVPRFALEYEATPDVLLYASAAQGFRMGGANFVVEADPAVAATCAASLTAFFGSNQLPSSYDSDSLWAYEAGAKTTLFDGRLRANVSAFHINWEDAQVPISIGGLGCGIGGLSTNLGSVTSEGAELELSANVTDSFSLSLGVSYIAATVDQDFRFPGASVTIARAGDRMPEIPEWSINLLGDYSFPISGETRGYVRGDVRYQDSRPARFALGLPTAQVAEGFTVANLRAGVSFSNVSAELFAENLTDERPFLLGEPAPASQVKGGRLFEQTLRPRTIGVRLSARY